MERIKKYFSEWDAARIFKLVLGAALGLGYLSTREDIYLFGTIILTTQAILNIGCMGGNCSTGSSKSDKQIIKTEKYVPKK